VPSACARLVGQAREVLFISPEPEGRHRRVNPARLDVAKQLLALAESGGETSSGGRRPFEPLGLFGAEDDGYGSPPGQVSLT
jgi:hypothetical protein